MDDNKNNDQQNTHDNQENSLKEKITELENNWKRALADYKNLERRTAEEKTEFAEFANMVLIQRMLPVLDNLQMLEKHINDTGLKMIIKEFRLVLEENGAVAMSSLGQPFNADTMDCVETTECEEKDDGKVIEVLTEGYLYRKKVLRAAKVKVCKSKS